MDQSAKTQQSAIRFSYNGVPTNTVVSPNNRTTVNLKSTFNEQGREIPIQNRQTNIINQN